MPASACFAQLHLVLANSTRPRVHCRVTNRVSDKHVLCHMFQCTHNAILQGGLDEQQLLYYSFVSIPVQCALGDYTHSH